MLQKKQHREISNMLKFIKIFTLGIRTPGHSKSKVIPEVSTNGISQDMVRTSLDVLVRKFAASKC